MNNVAKQIIALCRKLEFNCYYVNDHFRVYDRDKGDLIVSGPSINVLYVLENRLVIAKQNEIKN